MQVVQPKPTRLYPSWSSSFCRPDLARYSPTTCEPGASEVLTQGLGLSPFALAFLANSPAPTITLGLEVLVHEVIAAITTSPCPRSWPRRSTATRLPNSPALPNSLSIACANPALTSLRSTRSCGRLGPASEGLTRAKKRVRNPSLVDDSTAVIPSV